MTGRHSIPKEPAWKRGRHQTAQAARLSLLVIVAILIAALIVGWMAAVEAFS